MSQADLEISLFHRDAESYGLALRFRHAASGQDKSATGSFVLDVHDLRQRQHDLPTAVLATRGQVALASLLACLRDGCAMLYLAAHGMSVDGEPQVSQQREDGSRARRTAP